MHGIVFFLRLFLLCCLTFHVFGGNRGSKNGQGKNGEGPSGSAAPPVYALGIDAQDRSKPVPLRRSKRLNEKRQLPAANTCPGDGSYQFSDEDILAEWNTGGAYYCDKEQAYQANRISDYKKFREIDPVFFAFDSEREQRRYLKSSAGRYKSRAWTEGINITLSAEDAAKDPVLTCARELERASIIEITGGQEEGSGVLTVSGPENAIQYLKDIPKVRFTGTTAGVNERDDLSDIEKTSRNKRKASGFKTTILSKLPSREELLEALNPDPEENMPARLPSL